MGWDRMWSDAVGSDQIEWDRMSSDSRIHYKNIYIICNGTHYCNYSFNQL